MKRHSKKRDAILECLRQTTSHPTAEWVYQQLKPTIPDLSLGTVYRNLALFREEGTILSLGTVDGQERFDFTTAPHAHFICRCCHSVTDLPQPPLVPSQTDLGGRIVEAFSVMYYGVCQLCAPECSRNDVKNTQ